MGSDESAPSNPKKVAEKEFINQLLQQYYHISQQNDPQLGKLSIYQHDHQNYQLAKLVQKFDSNDQATQFINKAVEATQFNCSNLLRIVYAGESEEKSYHAIIYFHHLERSFYDEIHELRFKQKFISEEDLWNSIEAIAKPISYLRQNSITHGDIRPENIGTTDTGELMLIPVSIITGSQVSNYDLSQGETIIPYLSPKQLEGIKQKLPQSKSNPIQDEVWSLGIMILELGTLMEPEDYYDIENTGIDQEYLDHAFILLRDRYSDEICDLVNSMLYHQEEDRPSIIDILLECRQQRQKQYQKDPSNPSLANSQLTTVPVPVFLNHHNPYPVHHPNIYPPPPHYY